MKKFEALDTLEFLGRYPRTRFARHVVEFCPGLERFRAPESARDGFDHERAARVGLEVVDRSQKVRTHGAQSLRTVEACLNILVAFVRKADDERKMTGKTVSDH